MNRALPATMVDLIRDGVPPAELKAAGGRAVYRALVSTAASAIQRGWTRPEWEALIGEARSRLGTQARVKDGKREQTARAHARTLAGAWTAAEKWLPDQPPPYDRDAARDRARAVRDWTADAETPLPDAERAILAHAAEVALHHGTDRPALPRRPMQEATRLGLTALRSALDRLHEDGLLVLEVRGRPGGPAARARRASCYRLPTDEAMHSYLYRETRSVVPPGQVCGAQSLPAHGAPVQVCGAPDERGPLMVTLTLSAEARTRARRADELSRRLHLELVRATGRLADPDDLPYDPAHLEDVDVLDAAIDELIARKPHLASRRPRGDVGQGAVAETAGVDLAGILRARAG